MLVVGLPNVTTDQAMVQMTLWSIWSAPLIMSNDLRVLKPEIKNILLNRDVIAVDQDPLGIMGKLVRRIEYVSIYVKPITPVLNGKSSYAVAVVNMHEEKDKQINFSLSSIGLTNENGYLLRNLWTGEDKGHVEPSYLLSFKLRPTSVSFAKLTVE
ncbi:Alpha-N-acetylgalactosaminidase [Trichostrongylus colubriformis]|uniref:alpha-galactosidase n=1 Tax=Trichostrongylus colubriformis TaxID=6319 RepID=A0AAN8FBJ4_TRICO